MRRVHHIALLLLVLMSGSLPTSARAAQPRAHLAQVVLGEVGSVGSLDPARANTAAAMDIDAAVFESLVTFGPTDSPQPALARHWTASPDGRTWTFDLRPTAHWQDGTPLTASDVVFTLSLASSASMGQGLFGPMRYTTVIKAVAASPTRVVVTVSQPSPSLLSTVGLIPILPAHLLARQRPRFWAEVPVGSGPFRVTANVPGHHVTLTAWKGYDGVGTRLDRIVVRLFATPASAQRALAAGRLDLLGSSAPFTPQQYVALLADAPTLRGYHTPGQQWSHLDLVETGFLAAAVVRRALARATPRQQIVQRAQLGLASPAIADQSPASLFALTTPLPPFGVTAARQMLLAAGFRRTATGVLARAGHALVITLWGSSDQQTASVTLALIARAWRAVGVQVTVRLVSEARLFAATGPLYNPRRFAADQMNAVLYSWVNGSDPSDSDLWRSDQIVTPQHTTGANFVGYRSAAMDALQARAARTVSRAARRTLYLRIQQQLVADQPAIFVAWADLLQVTSRALSGYQPNPFMVATTWNCAHWTRR